MIKNRLTKYTKGISPLKLFSLSLIGSIAAYFGEMAHEWAGIWKLSNTIAATGWIPVVYFFCLCITGIIFYLVDRHFKSAISITLFKGVIEVIYLLIIFVIPMIFITQGEIAALILLCFLLYRLIYDRASGDIWIVCSVILIDHTVELILINFLFYHYQHPAYFSLPIWLAPFWGAMGISLRRLFSHTFYTTSS